LFSPEGKGRVHAHKHEQGYPQLLDQARNHAGDRRNVWAKVLGSPCVTNVWNTRRLQDTPCRPERPSRTADGVARRKSFPKSSVRRTTLMRSKENCFGIGSKHMSPVLMISTWAMPCRAGKLLCLDAGHFHHRAGCRQDFRVSVTWIAFYCTVSRGVSVGQRSRGDALGRTEGAGEELVPPAELSRPHAYRGRLFRCNINRVAAWVIGARNMQKALLAGLLEPYTDCSKTAEF